MASSTLQQQQHPVIPTSNNHQNHTHQVSNLPPQQQQQSSVANNNNYNNNNVANDSSINSKKRQLDYDYLLQSSPYFKIRAFLNDLRPLFLEVLRAPEFQNCEAARRIQDKMKHMVDLCRQSKAGNAPQLRCNSRAGSLDCGSDKQGGQNAADQVPQEKRFPVGNNNNNHEKSNNGSHRIPGTYIVGGSAFGWNFITFHGTKPEYYGRTKEAFRAAGN